MFKRKGIILGSLVLLSASILSYAQEPNVTPIKRNIVASTPEDEAKVTNTIKKGIKASKTLSNLNIEIVTKKGVVTLTGTVDSNSQIITLVELAESVIGVSDVDTSNLKVKEGSQPLADSLITAKIKGLFIREELFGEKDLAFMDTKIETKDGVVHITGVVDNKAQIDNAVEIIKKNLPEVKKIVYSVKKFTPFNQNDQPDQKGTNNTNQENDKIKSSKHSTSDHS